MKRTPAPRACSGSLARLFSFRRSRSRSSASPGWVRAVRPVVDSRRGLHDLRARFAVPVRPRWYAALLIPPATILTVLLVLRKVVSANFAPNFFAFGVIAGLLAGFCEELGWTGFAYPRMRERFGALLAAVALDALWAVWHLPIVD